MDENRYYTTVQGDMWDSIAYQFYGDTKYIGLLFENNQDPVSYTHLDVYKRQIYFLVGIQDQNPNRQGHFDVANVLNKLQDRFLKDRLIDQRYRIQFPITKKFQEEDTWPKFIGGMSRCV